jgi:acetolactate synthase regulatory subunit
MESYVMTVVCSPQLSALARVIAVLHARKAEISALHYGVRREQAELVIEVAGRDVTRLAAQLRRLVDVADVQVALSARVAVAS